MQQRIAQKTDLAAVKELDDRCFIGQQGVSEEELEAIMESGRIILLEDDSGRLIGQSQLVFGPATGIPYQLLPDEAYYCGTSIEPCRQGQGLGKLLAEAQDQAARSAGKDTAVLSCRVENYPSLKLRLSQGFCIVAYAACYYGPMLEGGARLILKKHLHPARPGAPDRTQCRQIEVDPNLGIDVSAHQPIQQLLADGFQGTSISKLPDGRFTLLFSLKE